MIPKKIHYCWFGGNPLNEMGQKCLASWKKFFPDYEIIEWNESNFDIYCCDYVREAYEAKKWAFVSDYARFKILYENGGIYFDTDVELIKPIDEIVSRGPFMGIESNSFRLHSLNLIWTGVNPGLGIGAPQHFEMYADFLKEYHERHFRNEDGTLNLKTIVEYTSEYLYAHGLKNENEIQLIKGVYIYPKEYFNPCDMSTWEIHIVPETVSIHHYAGSWVDPYSKMRGKISRWVRRCFGKKTANFLRRIFGRRKS